MKICTVFFFFFFFCSSLPAFYECYESTYFLDGEKEKKQHQSTSNNISNGTSTKK